MAPKTKSSRNPDLIRGVGKYSRSKMYHKRGLWAIKAKNGGVFPRHDAQPKPQAPAVTPPKYYPADDVKKPLINKRKARPTKLRASITPGTVLIILAGRFKGKRVVFLKQLTSGLLLITADSGMRPPTLNIFPSQPMHVEPSSSTKLVSAMGHLVNPEYEGSKRPLSGSSSEQNTAGVLIVPASTSEQPPQPKAVKCEGNSGRGPVTNLEHERPKTPDAKTLRRLAQNREAARKSRLRKKAYIQQLESSRVKLTQLEQEIQKSARAQGYATAGSSFVGEQGLPLGIGNLSSDAVLFDVEYGRWLEEHQRLMCELRAAMQEHVGENELRLFVENCLSHFNEMLNLKCMVAKADVFHIFSGTWKSPAERCFMWIGGFRPSDIIKMIPNQVEPLSEAQVMNIYALQQSTMEAEEALSQGLDALNESLSDVIISDSLIIMTSPPANYMGHMGLAMGKLSTLQGFVRQADSLRQQTIQRLLQLLTSRQSAKSLLAVSEYFHRLRTLSSLWLARPRQDNNNNNN